MNRGVQTAITKKSPNFQLKQNALFQKVLSSLSILTIADLFMVD